MLRLTIILTIFLLFLSPSKLLIAANDKAQSRVQSIDRIVAIVNEDVITQFEFDNHKKFILEQLNKQGTNLPPAEVLDRQLLERMINDRVQLTYAKEIGLRIDDAQLDKALQRIAENNKLSMQAFRNTLERDGVDFSKFREEIREEMIIARLREREIDNKLMISEAEVENYLSRQAKESNEQYNLAHILVSVPERASPAQVEAKRQRAEQALVQLQNGSSFAQVSAGFSDATDALQGGVLGWRTGEQLPAIFLGALKQIKIGQVTPILQSANGFHIVKLLEKRGQNMPAVVTQTHARHILIKTNELVSENEAKNRLLQVKERIDNGGNFIELAKAHSEDMTAAKGGDLGWVYPGDTVPEFERAMDGLKENQVSEPIRSPFGWHLIQVLTRRTESVSSERQKILAREALRVRKSDEAYQEWQRQLRDRAYVEYRLEER